MFDPLQIPNVWRAQSLQTPRNSLVPSSYAALDDALGGGWPRPALIEVLTDVYGIGELQLVLPLLRSIAVSESSLIVWLNPPHQPNVVALDQHELFAEHWSADGLSERDALWSMEQALRSDACAAALAWIPKASTAALRRLKLALSLTSAVGILFRPCSLASQPSPAHVRVALRSDGDKLRAAVLKVQGRKPSEIELDIVNGQLLRQRI